MKKYLVIITALLTLGTVNPAAAQNNKKSAEATELVDSVNQNAVEVYSDTTDTAVPDDTTLVSSHHRIRGYTNAGSVISDVFDSVGAEGLMGMTFVLMIIVIIFIIAPVIILALLFFFIYKNRKQKVKLAEMAVKQGQPIPDQLLVEHKETDNELWQKGLRQTFLGVGLLAFFGYLGSTLGIGIGILVTVIGLGKLAIVKTSKKV